MSLINKMLQDLELRHATLQGEVRPLYIRALPLSSLTPQFRWVRALRSLLLWGMAITMASAATWWIVTARQAATAATANPANVAAAIPISFEASSSLHDVERPSYCLAVASHCPENADTTAPVAAAPAEREEPQPVLAAQDIEQLLASREGAPATGVVSSAASSTATRPPSLPVAQAVDAAPVISKKEHAVNESPADSAWRRAQEAIAQQRLDEAESLLDEAVRLQPNQSLWAMRLAQVQIERENLPAAASTLNKALATGAQSAEFHALYAGVLQRLTQHRQAIGEYQAALRLAPGNGIWWMGLALSLEAEHHTAEARTAYQRAYETRSLSAELNQFVESKLR
ncbi:MAG: tetratricopeptide repeat protein [Burkholderiaceae bacterium]|nr:MAG: tetratricopeptide repeat protein [Burkholderiaceae bacterium]